MKNSGAGAGVASQRERPKGAGKTKDDGRPDHELQHQRAGLAEGFNQQPRRDVGDDHDRNDPAEDEFEEARENRVWVTRDVEEIEVAVNQALRADDPKTDRGQAEHDRVMDRDAETDRDEVEQDRHRTGNVPELRQRKDDDHAADDRIHDTVEPELFCRNRELAVDWQDKERIELARAHQFGDGGDVGKKERLEKLRDHLMRADEQNDFPFCPITDAVDIAEDDREENDLADEPEDFDQHPKEEIRLEAHLANERIAKHDRIDLDVTSDHVCLSF